MTKLSKLLIQSYDDLQVRVSLMRFLRPLDPVYQGGRQIFILSLECPGETCELPEGSLLAETRIPVEQDIGESMVSSTTANAFREVGSPDTFVCFRK